MKEAEKNETEIQKRNVFILVENAKLKEEIEDLRGVLENESENKDLIVVLIGRIDKFREEIKELKGHQTSLDDSSSNMHFLATNLYVCLCIE